MRIDAIELRRVRLPLVAPFAPATGTTSEREALLVKVTAPDAEGWGECTAMAEPLYTSEYVDGAQHVLRHHLVPRLLAQRDVTPESVGGGLGAVRGHPMAKAALELAVLDAQLRSTRTPLAAYLGGVRGAVDAGVAVGTAGSVAELLDWVAYYLQLGYRRVKLKIGPGWDFEPLGAVRERFPWAVLQVDANGSYTPAFMDHLAALDAFGLAMIEQPFPADELSAHAWLAQRLRTPICLDESITSAAAAGTAIWMRATSVVNVKAGRVGGYLEARRVHDVCVASGVPVWCGGMLETGLGRAANVALASLPGFTLPGDLSASDRYYRTDLTAPFVLEDGRLRVPTGPGLGVEPVEGVLEECTTDVEVVTAA